MCLQRFYYSKVLIIKVVPRVLYFPRKHLRMNFLKLLNNWCKNRVVSDRPWRRQQMRVLFVLSSRRAFRGRTHKHSVLNYAGVRRLIFRCCERSGRSCLRVCLFVCLFLTPRPDRAFLDVSLSWWLSLPGGGWGGAGGGDRGGQARRHGG